MCSGQDFHHLLDRYTLEQIEVLAQCAWQHKITQMGVVAYALGGSEARERAPAHPSSRGDQPQGAQESIGWENAHGEWRLYERAPDGSLRPQKPKGTPEQAEANYNRAMSQLFGVQSATARMSGRAPSVPSYLKGKGAETAAVARMKAQAESAPKPGGS